MRRNHTNTYAVRGRTAFARTLVQSQTAHHALVVLRHGAGQVVGAQGAACRLAVPAGGRHVLRQTERGAAQPARMDRAGMADALRAAILADGGALPAARGDRSADRRRVSTHDSEETPGHPVGPPVFGAARRHRTQGALCTHVR